MKKFSFSIALLLSSIPLFGMDGARDLVNKAYEKNLELKSLESSINIAKKQISVASKYKNPTLSFGATDVWLSDISNRDSEAMQAYFLGISQTLPLNTKLETKASIARNDYVISKLNFDAKKIEFRANIHEYLYNIALLQERIVLYTKLQNNVQDLENLLNELYKFNKAKQTQILKTQVLKDELSLKKIELYNLLQTQTINLEKITYSKFEDFKIDTKLKNIKLETNFSHPKILALIENEKKFNNISLLEKQKKNSDIKTTLTYFERDEKFEDYVNISFAIPLSVYGTEDIKSKQAKFKTLEIKNKLEDMKFAFEKKIETFQTNINNSIKTHKLIKTSIIPKLYEVQKTLENYNSFSKINSSELVKNVNEIIKYEIKAINEKQKYFTSLSKAQYFSKEIK